MHLVCTGVRSEVSVLAELWLQVSVQVAWSGRPGGAAGLGLLILLVKVGFWFI